MGQNNATMETKFLVTAARYAKSTQGTSAMEIIPMFANSNAETASSKPANHATTEINFNSTDASRA